jgi:hypothetical protein
MGSVGPVFESRRSHYLLSKCQISSGGGDALSLLNWTCRHALKMGRVFYADTTVRRNRIRRGSTPKSVRIQHFGGLSLPSADSPVFSSITTLPDSGRTQRLSRLTPLLCRDLTGEDKRFIPRQRDRSAGYDNATNTTLRVR